MSKTNSAGNAVSKFLTYLLVVLLVLGIVGFVAYFALRGQGVTYYVEYDGERYLSDLEGGNISLLNGETHTFTVKSLTGGEVNYDVKVQSNYSNNFDFVIDGENYRFYSETAENNDYTDVFNVVKTPDGFALTLPEGFTVEQAIETKFGGDAEIQKELQSDLSYFVITVTSGESSVSLWFTFGDLIITLDQTEIVF